MTAVVPADKPTGALALTSDQHDWTPEQAAALVQLGLGDAPAADLKVFLHQSQRTGLDPFLRQIYMIGRWDGRSQKNKYTIQAAIDGLRIVAERHGQYGGGDGPYWCGEDGVWHDMWVGNKPPVAAKVGVVRKDWAKPMYAVALFAEYAARKKDGNLESMWASRPAGQLAKCAEALALRKAFPHDLSGIYTSDEMAQADNPPVRLVIDQEPDERPVVAVAERVPSATDWDAEIRACGNDRVKLLTLYKAAPEGAVRDRIAELGKKLKAAQPIIVDAEIVEDTPARTRPSKLDKARSVNETFDQLLDCADFGDAEAMATTAPRIDVTGFLTDDIREALGIGAGEKFKLPEFGQLVADYINRHKYSVNSAINGEAA